MVGKEKLSSKLSSSSLVMPLSPLSGGNTVTLRTDFSSSSVADSVSGNEVNLDIPLS